LHLDASQYDPKLNQTTTLLKSTRPRRAQIISDAQESKLKETFFENVLSTGSPEMSSRNFDELAEELQCRGFHGYLRMRLNKERRAWMRAAAVLRRMGVYVDYKNIPHLAWLEEVGRL
jgi:hypothetical protein